MEDPQDGDRTERRIVRFLASGAAHLREAAVAGRLLLEAPERGTIAVPADAVAKLVRSGVAVRDGMQLSLALSVPGEKPEAASAMAATCRDLGVATFEGEGRPAHVLVNLAESPLAQLMRRKDRKGAPFLSQAEFRAGERLRVDYTRGQIMPRLGANWVATVSSGRRDGGNGIAELTEAALAARIRVENAVAAIGPELAGVLVDICCFLKGLERVEVERGWPVRSAKIVLKTALGALSRHYEPEASRKEQKRVLHWGARDYRPNIGG